MHHPITKAFENGTCDDFRVFSKSSTTLPIFMVLYAVELFFFYEEKWIIHKVKMKGKSNIGLLENSRSEIELSKFFGFFRNQSMDPRIAWRHFEPV